MEIGDIVVLTQDHTFILNPYSANAMICKKGHKFRIRDSGNRGFDIESIETGVKITLQTETKFLVSLSDLREEKLK